MTALLPWAKRSPLGWFLGRNDIGNYMHRWYLQTPWFTVRLHHILRSDEARALHDHPWDFCSLLLSGGYLEVRQDVVKWWPRFSIVRRRAEDLHRLVIPKPVWTLVITGPKRREWGFRLPTGEWIHWKKAQEMWADYEETVL